VLDAGGGALKQMLPPFKLGVGGPAAGGRQFFPWVHRDDVAGAYVAAADGGDAFQGAINLAAPRPVTNRAFSRSLGKALHRPAVAPVPGFALKAMFGEMSTIVVNGVNMVPKRLQELGYAFRHPDLDEALRDVLKKD
jgi:uncharacterized protein (TIGR01777 family)